jgi:hypothetical protein
MTMATFKITFKKTYYATLFITAKTAGEAELLAWRKVSQDRDTNGQVLEWGGIPPGNTNYEVIINSYPEE